MTRRSQIRLVFQGAILMTITMLVESPVGFIYALTHGTDDLIRQYLRQSHSVLMVTGIWMIATGMALPFLELTERGISWLVWSLIIAAYSFMAGIAVFIAGLWRYHPDPTRYQHQIDQLKALPHHIYWINISLLFVSGVLSILPAGLIVLGAYRASNHSALENVR